MSWPEAANPLAYLRALAELVRETRLLVRELREGVSPDHLFNLGLSGFLFAALALVRGNQPAAVLLALALPLFIALCLLVVSRTQRRDGD